MTNALWSYKLKNAGNGFLIREEDREFEYINIADVFMTNDPKIAEKRASLMAASPDLLSAVEALLLFHSAGEWDGPKRTQWSNLSGGKEATTKVLCDLARAAVKKAGAT